MSKGIIRRLDDLGRIVVPKEYRRQFKIEIGDPMEIIATESGDIILRRLDLTALVKSEGMLAAEALSEEIGKAVAVCDRKAFLGGVGSNRNEVVDMPVSGGVLNALDNNSMLNTSTSNDALEIDLRAAGYPYFAFAPIFGNGRAYGGMTVFSFEPVTDEEMRILKMTARMVAINLQRY